MVTNLLNLMVMEDPGLILFLMAHMLRSRVASLCSNVHAAGTWNNKLVSYSNLVTEPVNLDRGSWCWDVGQGRYVTCFSRMD